MNTIKNQCYIPFQEQSKCIIYKILHYGQSYFNYNTYLIAKNSDNIDCIYIDNEPCLPSQDMDTKLYMVEIHYKTGTQTTSFKSYQLTNKEISKILGFYGCKV
jgi:hypothetical protein